MTNLTLALDAMGGDFGPSATVPAALQALRLDPSLKIIIVGDRAQIEQLLPQKEPALLSRIEIVHTTEVVEMADRPTDALRNCKQSSMYLMLELVRDDKAQACISAGNTGALMVMSKILLKTLPGIDRPALVSRLPTMNHDHVYLLDLGANISCCSETLFQFAVMGSVLCEAIDKKDNPKVALLNIGIEEGKGNEQVQQTSQLLQQCPKINYSGFIEGDDIYSGGVDIIVCDGFVGNISLKASEGIAKFLVHRLKKSLKQNILMRLMAKLATPYIDSILDQMNPDHYNGASLVGLRGIVVKSHGCADESAFLQAITLAVTEAQRQLPTMIERRLESILLDITN